MKRQLLLAEFMAQPWALEPDRLRAYATVVRRWSAGESASPEVMASVRADVQQRQQTRAAAPRAGGKSIAVLPLYGVISQRANMVDDVSGSGGTSTEIFTKALRQALADETISAIVIDADSPGGGVFGVSELASVILAVRETKPIIGIANSLAASAAYWLLASCSSVYATPGAQVGSIGVYAAHDDLSGAMEMSGVRTTLVSAGTFKTEGSPFAPLDDAARATMQDSVNQYYALFLSAVAAGRGVSVEQVRSGMGQGRVLSARDALAAKMVDGIATRDQVVQHLARGGSAGGLSRSGGRSATSVAMARNRLVLAEAGPSTTPAPSRTPNLDRARRELDRLEFDRLR